MKRFFFDVAAQSQLQRDYQGRQFEKPEQARELAELIALDLECSDDGRWAGAEVQVHTDCGARLFSVPVRSPQFD
jgi:hypothetical protein